MDMPTPKITIREGSTADSFEVEIVIPMQIALPDYSEGMRALAPIQPGGRLLLYDQIRFDDVLIRMMLTLLDGDEKGSYLVVGELYGSEIQTPLVAELAIDDHPYEAYVHNQKVEFANVHIPPEFDTIRVRLKTIQ